VGNFIDGEGSLNYKILKALCLSQVNEECTDVKENANEDIIFIIREKNFYLVNEDKELVSDELMPYMKVLREYRYKKWLIV